MENEKIEQEIVDSIPYFKTKEDAEKYFKEKYGDRFFKTQREPFKQNDQMTYQFLLVLDPKKFEEMREWIRKNQTAILPSSDPETKGFTDSFQTIYIRENGEVIPLQ